MAAEFGLTPANRTAIIANALSIARGAKDPMEQILTSGLDDAIVVEGGSNFLEDDDTEEEGE